MGIDTLEQRSARRLGFKELCAVHTQCACARRAGRSPFRAEAWQPLATSMCPLGGLLVKMGMGAERAS